jgi:myosin-5
LSQFEQLLEAKRVADDKMEQAISTIQKQEADIKRMTDELALGARAAHERQTALEEATARTASDESTISGLRADVASLREQINRANALSALTRNSQPQPPPSPTVPHLNGGIRGLDPAPNMPSTRRVRRHSMTGLHANDNKRSSTDERMMDSKKDISQFRAVSMAMPTNGVLNDRDSQGMPVSIENTREAITRLLENSAALDEDVLNGLITQLKIVPPSLANPPIFNEVMFPSHLISLIANEMWKQDMIKQSERFLANVMQTIQQHVMVSFCGLET